MPGEAEGGSSYAVTRGWPRRREAGRRRLDVGWVASQSPRALYPKSRRKAGTDVPTDPPNHGKPWTDSDIGKLDKLADGNTPTGLIAHKLGRTEDAVRSKASEEDISLKPVNQSPYNRRKG